LLISTALGGVAIRPTAPQISDRAKRVLASVTPNGNGPGIHEGRQDGGAMDDAKVLHQINELAREEHELFDRESHASVSDAARERLRRIQVTLDQCWDLLRQRRARRAAGLEPDDAQVRDEKTVEGYTE